MTRLHVPELVALRTLIAAVVLAWPVSISAIGAVTLTEIPAARIALTFTTVALLTAGAVWVTYPPHVVSIPARGGRHRKGRLPS